MLDKIIKLQSNQGGPFTATNNLISFTIPYDGVYDFASSYIDLSSEIIVTPKAEGGGIYNPIMRYNACEQALSNASFVRHARLSTQRAGLLEDVQRCDILRTNLDNYTKTISEKQSIGYRSAYQVNDKTKMQYSIWRDFKSLGDISSRDVQAPIQIPLKSLFSLGKMRQMPFNKMGRGTVALELNIADWVVTQNTNLDNQDENEITAPVAATHTGTTLRTLVLKNSFPNMDECPYYVGQVLAIADGAVTGAGAFTAYAAHAKVVQIQRGIPSPTLDGVSDATNHNRVTLTFGDDIFSGLASTTSTIAECTLEVFEWDSAEFRINSAEIVLKRIANPAPSQNSMTFTTFTTEQLSVSDESNFQHQFVLEPSCVNAFLMFPDGKKLIGTKIAVETYRFRINNTDVVNRDININQKACTNALHYELLMRTFVNAGIHIKSFLEIAPNSKDDLPLEDVYKDIEGNQVLILGCPTPLTSDKKLFQVNITTDATAGKGVNQVALFKQVIRTIKF